MQIVDRRWYIVNQKEIAMRWLRDLPSVVLVAACLLSGRVEAQEKRGDGLYAEVMTNKGLIVLQLEFEKAPMTCANFVGLAEGTIDNAALAAGTPFFNGTKWHRVVAGHVIQCGIPVNGKARDTGYEFPNEIRLPELNHGKAGMVTMANAGPHTNSAEWCITLGDRSYLDGDYTVFGRVVQGMDVVLKIAQGDEVKSVKIVRVGMAAEAFKPTTASFKKMVEEAKARVKEADEKKRKAEEELIATNWPKAVAGANGLKYLIVREGTGNTPQAGKKLRVSYSGSTLYGKTFVSTSDGTPYLGDKPVPFTFDPGKTPITPGFDATIAQMKKGEIRTLIVPADQGYRASGFYAKERPGEKRFVLSPNTVLVYSIELIDILEN
jgi:cyclophilin family peptidyl-prolyl cis-trans isomerase